MQMPDVTGMKLWCNCPSSTVSWVKNTPNFSPLQKNSREAMADEGFFDLLSRFQSNRMDDQRCFFQERTRFSAASMTTPSTPPKTMRKCNFPELKSVPDFSSCQILAVQSICVQTCSGKEFLSRLICFLPSPQPLLLLWSHPTQMNF